MAQTQDKQMARAKITKLSDPSNPYGGKKTPTRERTPAEKMDAAARSRNTPSPKTKKPEPARQKKDGTGFVGRNSDRIRDRKLRDATGDK